MQKAIKYTIFKTEWGYFGLVGTENGLLRTHLPLADSKKLKLRLLENLGTARHDKWHFNSVQKQIKAYFECAYTDLFEDVPIELDGFTDFARAVLTACRQIGFGQRISYGRLAQKIRRAGAARAVGSVMAKNPLPLIIPCHRVVRSDGKIGGFSGPGGTRLKTKMLLHEQHPLK